ncbi:hypothetical protein GCM10009727_83220 [Actinomadura napierensis]|uniref:Uncharacterized protein n=1 Tax=Actinomadura napierensis TaxID=267854 RepID=A0ABP5M4Z3_9ACTN
MVTVLRTTSWKDRSPATVLTFRGKDRLSRSPGGVATVVRAAGAWGNASRRLRPPPFSPRLEARSPSPGRYRRWPAGCCSHLDPVAAIGRWVNRCTVKVR